MEADQTNKSNVFKSQMRQPRLADMNTTLSLSALRPLTAQYMQRKIMLSCLKT